MWKKLKNVYNGKTKEKRKNYNWKKYLAAKEYLQKKFVWRAYFLTMNLWDFFLVAPLWWSMFFTSGMESLVALRYIFALIEAHLKVNKLCLLHILVDRSHETSTINLFGGHSDVIHVFSSF